jgi:hypothetical protein
MQEKNVRRWKKRGQTRMRSSVTAKEKEIRRESRRGKGVGKEGKKWMEAGCCGREARTTEAGKVTEDGRR